MESTLLEQGLELMLVGMGTVFVFLTTLVLATTGMSRLVLRFAPVPIADTLPGAAAEAEEIAAITAAIARYRSRR